MPGDGRALARPSGMLHPGFTDDALALRFAERYTGELRYVAAWGKWLHWTGRQWEREETLLAFDLARGICRTAAARNAATYGKLRPSSPARNPSSRRTVCKSRPAGRRHRRPVGRDPWLLNTTGGIVDLRTGDYEPHNPRRLPDQDYGGCPRGACPLWRQLPRSRTGGDYGVAGVPAADGRATALTGVTVSMHCFFVFGTGANGKSVFIDTSRASSATISGQSPSRPSPLAQRCRHPTGPCRCFTVRGLSPPSRPRRDGVGRRVEIKALTVADADFRAG